MGNRWKNNSLSKGELFDQFWEEYLSKEKNLLYILGWGFDPRMCHGIKKILEIQKNGTCECVLIEYKEGKTSPSKKHGNLKEINKKEFDTLTNNRVRVTPKKISMVSGSQHKTGSREAAKIFENISDFKNYTDVLIDISAMPVSIYFPLVGKILHIIDIAKEKSLKIPNFHIIVTENPEIDSNIHDMEIDDRQNIFTVLLLV